MADASVITVNINGTPQQIAATLNLAMALQHCDHYQACAAVAVNQMFIPKQSYATTMLQAGDCIDILMPMQGG